METPGVSRRSFLVGLSAGAGAAWVAANWPAILAAQEHAHRAAASRAPVKFEFFTPEQAKEVEAIAAQIIPSDELPGAREARVIYFIDRALMTFDQDQQKVYREGLPKLQEALRQQFPAASKFSAATPEQQIAVLKTIEKSEFFETVRGHTVMGFLCDPTRGGNFDKAGWKLIGFEDTFQHEPPFGYYDRDAHGSGSGEGSRGGR